MLGRQKQVCTTEVKRNRVSFMKPFLVIPNFKLLRLKWPVPLLWVLACGALLCCLHFGSKLFHNRDFVPLFSLLFWLHLLFKYVIFFSFLFAERGFWKYLQRHRHFLQWQEKFACSLSLSLSAFLRDWQNPRHFLQRKGHGLFPPFGLISQ